MADELAAMANTASGIIILGVDDKSREILGMPPEKLDIGEIFSPGAIPNAMTNAMTYSHDH